MKARFASLLLACIGLLAATAGAAVPTLLSYQGRVSDASGVLIGNSSPTNRTITFKFYNTSTGGTPLYAEAQTVTISAGEFSVLLGSGTGVSGLKGPSAPALTPYITLVSILSGNIYLGVTVDDGTSAADPEIAPRQQIVSAAFAYRAQVAETIVDGALGTSMIANSAVTTDKIGGGAVTNAKIAADAVTTANILSGSVTSAKINDNAVTSSKIQDGEIYNWDIANNAVTSSKILDGEIYNWDLANNAVTSSKIQDGEIYNWDLANNAVTSPKIADGSVDINKLAAAVQQALTPPGTIVAYGGDNPPPGWFMCAGGTVSRSTYATLYSVIGNRFGSGDGSTTFHLPDLRGQFLRGRDAGAGRDPDRGSRTAMNPGGATGDAVGSIQGHMFQWHTHSLPTDGAGGGVDQNAIVGSSGNDETWSSTPGSGGTGGNETRPVNAYVNFIIKY